MSGLLSDTRGQFAYFDEQIGHPDWSRVTVLDFGGNRGNLLEDAGSAIDPSRYWCFDVLREAIDEGARRHPDAHFVHYDRWHYRYNPNGIRQKPLPHVGQRFHFIVAYSVFTMLDEEEIVELATALRAQLNAGGVLAFTFIDPHHRQRWNGREITNLAWRIEVAAAAGYPVDLEATARTSTCYLIEQRGIEAAPRLAFETFITADRVRELLPGCETRAPANGVRHHCCVIREPVSAARDARPARLPSTASDGR